MYLRNLRAGSIFVASEVVEVEVPLRLVSGVDLAKEEAVVVLVLVLVEMEEAGRLVPAAWAARWRSRRALARRRFSSWFLLAWSFSITKYACNSCVASNISRLNDCLNGGSLATYNAPDLIWAQLAPLSCAGPRSPLRRCLGPLLICHNLYNVLLLSSYLELMVEVRHRGEVGKADNVAFGARNDAAKWMSSHNRR